MSADNSNVLPPGALHPLAPAFQENKAAMDGLVARLRQLIATAVRGGGDKAIKRHRERGKLLPRERIDALLDPGSPFLELSQLAGHGMYGALPLHALAGCLTPPVLLPPRAVRHTRRHTELLQVHAEHRSCAHKLTHLTVCKEQMLGNLLCRAVLTQARQQLLPWYGVKGTLWVWVSHRQGGGARWGRGDRHRARSRAPCGRGGQ